MAYNNYFPMGYQYYSPQYGYQPQMGQNENALQNIQANPQMQRNGSLNGLIWVQGEAGAKAYPVAPGQTVDLWDSENQVVYLKSADASGMPSMKILDYTIRENGKQMNALQGQFDMSNFVTKDELKKALEGIRNESIVRTDKQTAIE